MAKVVFSGRHLKILEETLDMRGRKKTLLSEVKSDTVFVVARLPNGKLLTERHYRPRIRKYLTEFVSGYINDNEKPMHAAVRELEEETGYVAGELRHLATIFGSPGWGRQRWHFFYATKLRKGRQGMDPDEVLTVKEASPSAVRGMMARHELRDPASLLLFFFYSCYVKKGRYP
jgi:ADP-ribose pyrophosphatase